MRTLDVQPLDQTLYISSFPRSDLLKYLYVIIDRLFIVPSHNRFISYTETDEEVSLIMDETSMEILDQYSTMINNNNNNSANSNSNANNNNNVTTNIPNNMNMNMNSNTSSSNGGSGGCGTNEQQQQQSTLSSQQLVECSTRWKAIMCKQQDEKQQESENEQSENWEQVGENRKNILIRGATTVKQLASCLSNQQISIMYLSLYDSELILVEEDKFELAIECLQNLNFSPVVNSNGDENSKNDSVVDVRSEEEKNVDESGEEKEEKDEEEICENHVNGGNEYNSVTTMTTTTNTNLLNEELQMDVTVLINDTLQVLRFCDGHSFQYHCRTLLDILFFYRRKFMGAFLSLTSFGDCHMLMANECLVQEILNENSNDDGREQIQVLMRRQQEEEEEVEKVQEREEILVPCRLKAVRIDEGALGFEETGIAARFAGALNGTIPILYYSTFLTDYCIIEVERLDEALDCLQQQSYRIYS